MSIIEEEIPVTPWIGPATCKNCLSITVLSSNMEIVDKLSTALSDAHARGSYQWKIVLVKATSLSTIAEQIKFTGNVALDFVILAMDTSRVVCAEWARINLAQLHPDLKRRRAVLVNAGGLPIYDMAVDCTELLELQEEFNIDMLSANVYDEEEAAHLARRLISYMEMAVGVHTGVPNLNV